MKTNMQKKEKSKMFHSELAQKIYDTFDYMLRDFEGVDKFYAFMSDKKKMYREDGLPTDEYHEWMGKISEYLRQHPIKEVEIDNSEMDELRIESLVGM